MSLPVATLVPGVLLVILGLPLLFGSSGAAIVFKAFPRSQRAAVVAFGGGAIWFLYDILRLSDADAILPRGWLFVAFAAIAVAAFKFVPDFLAVRGSCVLVLLGAAPLLEAAYMEYSHPQRLFMVGAVYVGIALAIWLGAQPWRLRDFFEWLFGRPERARGLGGLLTVYGLALCGLAFSY